MVIWRHAVVNDMTVISKDQDFYSIATSPGAETGRLIWVIGNSPMNWTEIATTFDSLFRGTTPAGGLVGSQGKLPLAPFLAKEGEVSDEWGRLNEFQQFANPYQMPL